MASTLTARALSTPHKTLDDVELRMAKAAVDGQSLSIEMTALVRDALVREFGSLKAAAIEMAMDQGQLTRELDAGKLNLARLQKCGAGFLLRFGGLMVQHMQPLSQPNARARQLIRSIRQELDELDQFMEHLA